jgi:NAD(P)-dependent dehydrogenase (short-subunit alcohol dehydrogenase family)
MMQDLAGKVAVITGAGSGIGAGIARAAAAADMRVVVADIDGDRAAAVAASLDAEALAQQVDVSDLDSVEALAAQVTRHFGGTDLLCNNAGVWLGARMQDADIRDWQWLINVNLYGVIHGIKAFLPGMVGRGAGHIVNTASVGGLIAGPPEGLYCTTKFAVVGLSEALALEVAEQGIGVSVLCPGLVDTGLIDHSPAVRPAALDPGLSHDQPAPDVASGISPDRVGGQVVDAVRDGTFYIITHDDYRDIIAMRHESILAALDQQVARYGSTSRGNQT